MISSDQDHWLAEFKYVELWYFTQEGCADTMHQQTQNEAVLYAPPLCPVGLWQTTGGLPLEFCR